MSSPVSAVNFANAFIPGVSPALDAFTSTAPVDIFVTYNSSSSGEASAAEVLAIRARPFSVKPPVLTAGNYDLRCDGRMIRIDFRGHPRPDEENLRKAIIRELIPALGDIYVWGKDEEGKPAQWLGSGFCVSPDLVRRIGFEPKTDCSYLLTNRHVASDLAEKIEVRTLNERSLAAHRLLADARYDVALLEVETGDAAIPSVQLVQEEARKEEMQGDSVLAFGQPHGLRRTVTQGIFSGWEEIDGINMIQIDAPINTGNSGGALVNFDGRLIGIPSFKPGDTEGIAFAYYIWDQIGALRLSFLRKQESISS